MSLSSSNNGNNIVYYTGNMVTGLRTIANKLLWLEWMYDGHEIDMSSSYRMVERNKL